jgi:hypothetical protein
MTATNTMDNFIGLSVVLTGFNQTILAPALDPVDIKSEYYPFFNRKIAEESKDPLLTDKIYSKYASLASQTNPKLTNQQIGEAMLDPRNGDQFTLACRKLIFMWYSGAWPTLIPATGTTPASTVSDLISDKSYTSGLAWQVMQSHPMGDSNYRYGYWTQPPADLNNYTGN